jgi:L-histidine Nalpha-methyltransferase
MPETGSCQATEPRVRIDVLLDPYDREVALADDVFWGLKARPKELPPKWFYDERGSQLFDEITRLPEYYLTRAERSILLAHAREIAALTECETLVELGSGTSEKTRILLDAMRAHGTLERFVPVDVSEEILRASALTLADAYPGMGVHAVVGDFERHLARLPRGGRRVIAFLGSSIGNMYPEPRARFLATLRQTMRPGDALLLGADLVKDPGRLEAAYNDARGVSSAFNLNVLTVLDRELGACFGEGSFCHVARWDAENEWMEMLVRCERAQVVALPEIDLDVSFALGEEMRTEISAKFRLEGLRCELLDAGLRPTRLWTDPARDFALALALA